MTPTQHEKVILSALGSGRPRKPRAIIDELKRKSYTEIHLRSAIWQLLSAGQIELTWNRKLQKVQVNG